MTPSCTPPSWPCTPSAGASSTSTPTTPASTASSPPSCTATAPSLVALYGVGTHTAAVLLVAAGDNAERIRSEAAFAHLCGVAPIQASSGKTTRHRLEPRRQPPSQPRPVADRVHPHELGPAHPRLRRTAHHRRTQQTRDHARPQALRRPRGLPPPPTRVAPTIGVAGLTHECPDADRLSCYRSVGPPLHPRPRQRMA